MPVMLIVTGIAVYACGIFSELSLLLLFFVVTLASGLDGREFHIGSMANRDSDGKSDRLLPGGARLKLKVLEVSFARSVPRHHTSARTLVPLTHWLHIYAQRQSDQMPCTNERCARCDGGQSSARTCACKERNLKHCKASFGNCLTDHPHC